MSKKRRPDFQENSCLVLMIPQNVVKTLLMLVEVIAFSFFAVKFKGDNKKKML